MVFNLDHDTLDAVGHVVRTCILGGLGVLVRRNRSDSVTIAAFRETKRKADDSCRDIAEIRKFLRFPREWEI